MATASVSNDIVNGTTADADDVMENFNDIVDFLNNATVQVDGSKSMSGILQLPASDPTTSNQATRKAYVDAGDTAVTNAFTLADQTKLTCDSGLKVKCGTTSITFSAATTSNTVTVTVSGITTLSAVTASVARGVALSVGMGAGNTFTVQGAWSSALSGSSQVTWIAIGT